MIMRAPFRKDSNLGLFFTAIVLLLEVDMGVDFASGLIDFVLKLRERDAFFCGHAFKGPEDALGVAPTTSGRHAVFEHFDEIDVEHVGFVVTRVPHILLFEEAVELVLWVVEFGEAVAEF